MKFHKTQATTNQTIDISDDQKPEMTKITKKRIDTMNRLLFMQTCQWRQIFDTDVLLFMQQISGGMQTLM